MKKSKILQLLRAMNKHDINKLADAVASPYFTKNEAIGTLFQLLTADHPNYTEAQLNKAALHAQLYPDTPFNDQQMRYLLTDLTKIIEQHIMLRKLEEEQILQQHLLITGMQDKNLGTLIPKVIDQGARLLDKYPYKDQKAYYDQFLLDRNSYEYVASRRNLAAIETLQGMLNNLDYYYIINKLKYSAELVNHTNIMAGQHEPLLLEEIQALIQKDNRQQEPAIQVYYYILQMLLHPENESHYYALKQYLPQHIADFPKAELNDMYIFARNYCARQINSGNTKYLRETFDLYNTLLEQAIIFQHGYLSQWDYKNMTAVGLRLEEYKWVKDFVEQYRFHLRPEHRENAYSYNKALYYYHLKDYDQTLTLLQHVEFTDVYYHLDYKSLLVKTYYATGEYEALHSLLEAFYVYLRRNKLISAYNKESYNNFLKIVKKLIKLRYRDAQRLAQLANLIKDTRPLANLSWIQKMLQELQQKTT